MHSCEHGVIPATLSYACNTESFFFSACHQYDSRAVCLARFALLCFHHCTIGASRNWHTCAWSPPLRQSGRMEGLWLRQPVCGPPIARLLHLPVSVLFVAQYHADTDRRVHSWAHILSCLYRSGTLRYRSQLRELTGGFPWAPIAIFGNGKTHKT